MKIKMTLLSDTIPGDGRSVPGAEDISVLTDDHGFPYYRGSSLKGIFREEMRNYLCWTGNADPDETLTALLGETGSTDLMQERKLRFSNLTLSETVRGQLMALSLPKETVLDSLSYTRTFTQIDSATGTAKQGSLRIARCLKKGIVFYGDIQCRKEDEAMVRDVLKLVKWIGTMRNRGFGNVKIEEVRS